MLIYKAFPAYYTYLNQYHKCHPSFGRLSFNEQLARLKRDFFPWVLSWSQFNTDDDVEVFETIHNDYYLQQSWCDNLYVNDPDWEKKIVLEQIRALQPDVCLIYPPEFFSNSFVDQVRDVVTHEVIVGGYDGMNRKNIRLYDGFDFVITCSKYICDYYKANGKTTFALEFGFDPKVLSSLTPSEGRYPVSFSGSIFEGIHDDRFELLSYLERKRTKVVISSEFEMDMRYSLLSRKMFRSIKRGTFGDFYDRYLIRSYNKGPLYGREMFQFLSDSDITINLHGDGITFAANVRLYEATGVGACLLTDWKHNIGEIFEPDKEIVTFQSKEEAYDKIKFLNRHENTKKEIARNGQRRTLSDYTYASRIPDAIRFVKQLCE